MAGPNPWLKHTYMAVPSHCLTQLQPLVYLLPHQSTDCYHLEPIATIPTPTSTPEAMSKSKTKLRQT